MSNGWDGTGSPRLICNIAGETGLAGEGVVPLVPGDAAAAAAGSYTGVDIYTPSTTTGMPTLGIGTSDYSMEWMIRGRSEDSDLGFENDVNSGLVTATSGDTVGVILCGMTCGDSEVSNTQVKMSPGVVAGRTLTHPGSVRWSHIGMVVDRSALATYYVNGVLWGSTTDVSSQVATSFAAVPIHPLQAAVVGGYDRSDDNHDLVDSAMLYMSSFAIHLRLLTAAEILVNSNAKIVGLYAETAVRYLFKTFLDASDVPITPTRETTAGNLSIFNKFALSEPEATGHYMPRVANGGLFIEDTSGNARHFPCNTHTGYSVSLGRTGPGLADSGAW